MKQGSACPQAIVAGLALVLLASLGLAVSALLVLASFDGAFHPMSESPELPYFYAAFYSMVGICILCQGLLALCGLDLILSRLRTAWLVMFVLGFEVLYSLLVNIFGQAPGMWKTVATASGLANMALKIQYFTLLPLWVPLLLMWALAGRTVPKEDAPKSELEDL